MEESEAAGGKRKSVTLALSKEHNPTIYEERMRIQKAGGTVRYPEFYTLLAKSTTEISALTCRESRVDESPRGFLTSRPSHLVFVFCILVILRDGRVLGVLEVSRSIGDGQYKRCGVISTPDLRRCQLTTNDK